MIGSGDQAVGELRRELTEEARRTTFKGKPAMKMNPAAVADLIDAYVRLRRQGVTDRF